MMKSSLPQFRQILISAVGLGIIALLSACGTTSSNASNQAKAESTYSASQPVLPATLHFQQAQVDPVLLLNRISWGVNATSLAQMNKLGMDGYLLKQLQSTATTMPTPIQKQIDAMTISTKPFEDMMLQLEQQREASAKMKGVDDSVRKAYQQELNRIAREAASRSLLRALYSSNQMLEQMDWFWMNHFNISSRKENIRAMLGDFEEHAIRPYALGNFRALLSATLAHPAMQRYLDNEHNAVGKINENYARELMELHTMGVGSGYTQNDVQELARVLTGLSLNLRGNQGKARATSGSHLGHRGLVEFNPKRHDFGDKVILGTKIQGSGLEEIDQVLTLLTRQPATARFVSRKLAMYFVSDKPSDALVQAMARTFLQTDGDIPSVLKTMFDSPEFIASLGTKFKDPLHYVVSAVRLSFDGSVIVNTGPMLNWLNQLGQQHNGHQTPDGYSLNEEAWSSAAQMTTRFDVAKLIARGVPNLFKPEGDDGSNEVLNIQASEWGKPALAQNPFLNKIIKGYSAASKEALTQSTAAQEWSAFFLASPEMMRR